MFKFKYKFLSIVFYNFAFISISLYSTFERFSLKGLYNTFYYYYYYYIIQAYIQALLTQLEHVHGINTLGPVNFTGQTASVIDVPKTNNPGERGAATERETFPNPFSPRKCDGGIGFMMECSFHRFSVS